MSLGIKAHNFLSNTERAAVTGDTADTLSVALTPGFLQSEASFTWILRPYQALVAPERQGQPGVSWGRPPAAFYRTVCRGSFPIET